MRGYAFLPLTVLWLTAGALGAGVTGTPPAAFTEQPEAYLAGYSLVDQVAPGRYVFTCETVPAAQWPAGGELRVALRCTSSRDYDLVTFSESGVALLRVREGRAVAEKKAPRPADTATKLSIRRSTSMTDVIWGNEILLSAYDTDPSGGQVLVASSGTDVPVNDAFVQPIGELRLEADFAVAGDSAAAWETPVGMFRPSGIKSRRPQPHLAANPFTYAAFGPDRAISTTGYWFWDGYEATAAAKGRPFGKIGICAYFQDRDNYVVFQWTAGDLPGTASHRQLIVVRNGHESVLAEADGGYAPEQWYRIGIRACRGHIEALIDESVVLSGRTQAFGQGCAALYAAQADQAFFDDVLVRRFERVAGPFDGPAGDAQWQRLTGAWTARQDVFLGDASDGEARLVLGEEDWQNIDIATTVRLVSGHGAGVWFACTDKAVAGYYVLRCGGRESEYPGEWQLVRVVGGRGEVVRAATGDVRPDDSLRVEVQIDGVYIALIVNGRMVFDYVDPELSPGRVGLYVDRGSATFSQLVAASADSEQLRVTITPQFTRESTMSGWASPRGAWTPPSGPERTRFYRGRLFGDCTVEVELDRLEQKKGIVSIGLATDGKSLETGYVLDYYPNGGVGGTLALRRLTQVVGSANDVSPTTDNRTQVLTFERRGSWLLAALDEDYLITYSDPEPLSGTEVGLRYRDMYVDLGRVIVLGSRMYDYTFSRAPADWWIGAGVWEVHDRWACAPGWAWFAGSGADVPVLWSKRRYQGDVVLEFYCAPIMDKLQYPGYSHPGDLNCTIGADGRRLDSGYSIVFAGWNNRKTAILRKDRVVAETSRVRLVNPTNRNNNFHRHWFHIRVEKRAGRISLSVDGREALTYEDPDPLPGGRVAFWTYNTYGGGMLNARTRISCEQLPELVPMPEPADDQEAATDIPRSLYEHPKDQERRVVTLGPRRA